MRFVNPRFMTDPQPFYRADPAAWRMVIETNIVGVFLMSRAVTPGMVAAGAGRIINVTINHATMTRPGFTPYGPSKAALEAMTQAWGSELEGTGVVVNLLALDRSPPRCAAAPPGRSEARGRPKPAGAVDDRLVGHRLGRECGG